MWSMSYQKYFNETFTWCHSLKMCSLVRTPPSYPYMVHICPGRKRSQKGCRLSVHLLKECGIRPFLSVFPRSNIPFIRTIGITSRVQNEFCDSGDDNCSRVSSL